MTIEERVELHDQWLLSMESNQSQMSASLAELARKQDRLTELVLTFGQNQSVLFSSMARLTTEMEALVEQHRKLEQTVERLGQTVGRLEQTVERYIRFRGNGHSEN